MLTASIPAVMELTYEAAEARLGLLAVREDIIIAIEVLAALSMLGGLMIPNIPF